LLENEVEDLETDIVKYHNALLKDKEKIKRDKPEDSEVVKNITNNNKSDLQLLEDENNDLKNKLKEFEK
jgi:hypothetical protein